MPVQCLDKLVHACSPSHDGAHCRPSEPHLVQGASPSAGRAAAFLAKQRSMWAHGGTEGNTRGSGIGQAEGTCRPAGGSKYVRAKAKSAALTFWAGLL